MLADSDPLDITERQMMDGRNMNEWKRELEAKPLRFAWIDGEVERICPDDDETKFALNTKRGILSSIQNTMTSWDDDKDEVDEVITAR